MLSIISVTFSPKLRAELLKELRNTINFELFKIFKNANRIKCHQERFCRRKGSNLSLKWFLSADLKHLTERRCGTVPFFKSGGGCEV